MTDRDIARLLARSKRKKALAAKRRADAAAINADINTEEEEDEEKQSGPGTSRGPKKFSPKDLLAALKDIPPAALGAVVAGSLLAAISAGAATLAVDTQVDTGYDRIALQEQKDINERQEQTIASISQFVNTLPEDSAEVINDVRGLRSDLEAMQKEIDEFAADMAQVKLNAITPEQYEALQGNISSLQAISSANSSAIVGAIGDVNNLGEDLGVVRQKVSVNASGIANAQQTAIDAAASATKAQTSADVANEAAIVANTAAESAQAASDRANVAATNAQAAADSVSEELADVKAQAEADAAQAKADSDEAKAAAAAAQATAEEAIADAAASQATADEALADAELALKKIPTVDATPSTRTIASGPAHLGAAGPAAPGLYYVDASVWQNCGTNELLITGGGDVKTQPGVSVFKEGNVTTFRGNVRFTVAGPLTWRFSQNGCTYSAPMVSLSFISE